MPLHRNDNWTEQEKEVVVRCMTKEASSKRMARATGTGIISEQRNGSLKYQAEHDQPPEFIPNASSFNANSLQGARSFL